MIHINEFEYKYHHSKSAGSDVYGRYVYHNLDVYCIVEVHGEYLPLAYQTGTRYLHDDYNYPDPTLKISEEWTDPKLMKLLRTVPGLVTHDGHPVGELPDDIADMIKQIKALDPQVSDFLDPLVFTDDPDDYVEDSEGNLLPLYMVQNEELV